MRTRGDGLDTVGLLLLHLGWQGTLVASLLAPLLRLSRDGSARLRYGLAYPAYALMLLLMCVTAFRLVVYDGAPGKPLGVTATPARVHLGSPIPDIGAGAGALARPS